jgi:hypothetical protein
MSDTQNHIRIEDLSKDDLLRLVPDFLHRIVVHYALWFAEVRHQMGLPQAVKLMLNDVFKKNLSLQITRLGETLGFEVIDGLPSALWNLEKDKLLNLIDAIAKNWLANDGLWFQAVEFSSNMVDAKRCNDSCWAHFSPFEAWSIKRILGLDDYCGLQGLAKALNLRVYARLNTQSVTFESENSMIFKMNVCRVQSARKRKNLEDYPCKSGGLVEYTYFARTIDPRIATECIGCPPDPHPSEWFCAWRFTINAP